MPYMARACFGLSVSQWRLTMSDRFAYRAMGLLIGVAILLAFCHVFGA